jgi:hypothetical protein
MKKVVAVLLAVMLLLTGCGGSAVSSEEAIAKYGSDTLKVYNVGEYIDTMIISDFEHEFGVKIVYEVFDSNEMMYTKLQSGDSYDILVPSDYMIQRLIEEGALQELDLSGTSLKSLRGVELPDGLHSLRLSNTPLKNLKELKYLEIFLTEFRDASLLSDMKQLVDLNICYTAVNDITPLLAMKDQLQHLWMNGTHAIDWKERQQLRDTLVNTVIRHGFVGSTEGGWRDIPNYFVQRDLLGMHYMKG